jgi:hypothetical protein
LSIFFKELGRREGMWSQPWFMRKSIFGIFAKRELRFEGYTFREKGKENFEENSLTKKLKAILRRLYFPAFLSTSSPAPSPLSREKREGK